MTELIDMDDWSAEQKIEFLDNWKVRRHELHTLSEDMLSDLLTLELKSDCRKSCLTTLHARYTLVRKERERKALVKHAAQKKAADRAARSVRGKSSGQASTS